MVELSTRKREFRGDGGNHDEKLGLKKISCGSQFTILDTAGMSPEPAGNHTNMTKSKPNPASRTPGLSHPLVFSISFSSSSLISPFVVHISSIIARTQSYIIPLYLCMSSSRVNSECSIRQVQHLWNAAYAGCSIRGVQHTPSAVYARCSMCQVQRTPSAAYAQCSIDQVQHTLHASYAKCSIRGVQHTPSVAFAVCSLRQVQHTLSTAHTEYNIPLRLSVVHSLLRF